MVIMLQVNKLYFGQRFDEDGEIEQMCSYCGEWWPADKEFFYGSSGKKSGLSSYCKDCYEHHYRRGKDS